MVLFSKTLLLSFSQTVSYKHRKFLNLRKSTIKFLFDAQICSIKHWKHTRDNPTRVVLVPTRVVLVPARVVLHTKSECLLLNIEIKFNSRIKSMETQEVQTK